MHMHGRRCCKRNLAVPLHIDCYTFKFAAPVGSLRLMFSKVLKSIQIPLKSFSNFDVKNFF